jgi:uncharacterized RDD family membrane protein YckC
MSTNDSPPQSPWQPGQDAPQAPPQWAPPPASHWEPIKDKAGPPEGYRFAGFWIRLLAYLIDGLILSSILIAIILLPTPAGRIPLEPGLTQAESNRLGILILIWVAFYLAYFPIFWALGATPGMRLFRLRVVRPDGSRLGIGRGIVRFIGFILSAWALYIGLIWAAFDDRKQGWHDKLADSFVVRPA